MIYNTSVKYIGQIRCSTRTNCNFYVHLRLLGILTICREVAPKCQMPGTWLTCFVLVASRALFYKLASKSHLYELMNFAVDSLTPLSCRSSGVRHVKRSRTHWSALRLNGLSNITIAWQNCNVARNRTPDLTVIAHVIMYVHVYLKFDILMALYKFKIWASLLRTVTAPS
jgi:hypothetical protein